MSLFSPDLGQGGPEGLGERKGRPLGGGWEPGTAALAALLVCAVQTSSVTRQ